MDEFLELGLPAASHMTMFELMTCDDPELHAAAERLMQRVLEADPEDGCC